MYEKTRTQWNYDQGMRIAFNYSPALAIATEREYSMELFISLMQVIEATTLSHDAEVREQERQRNHGR